LREAFLPRLPGRRSSWKGLHYKRGSEGGSGSHRLYFDLFLLLKLKAKGEPGGYQEVERFLSLFLG